MDEREIIPFVNRAGAGDPQNVIVARISDNAMFIYPGELVEYDKTKIMFSTPKESRTEG